MEKNTLVKYILIALPVVIYLVYTTRYSFVLFRNVYLTKRQKNINLILIWLIPFIWILFLKTFFQSTPGSHQVKIKKNPDSFTESGLGVFDDMSHHSNDHN